MLSHLVEDTVGKHSGQIAQTSNLLVTDDFCILLVFIGIAVETCSRGGNGG